jgi:hypothetical protein
MVGHYLNSENIDEINLPKLLHKIEAALKGHPTKPTQEPGRKGKKYIIQTDDARMEVVINESWIGYELNVPDARIGNFEDTDNYPLGGKNLEISMEIFDEVVAALEGSLAAKIYAGAVGKKKAIAIPAPGGV